MVKAKKDGSEYIVDPARVFFPPIPTENEPRPVVAPYKKEDESKVGETEIVKVSVGGRANLAVSKSGHVFSWGYGASCQVCYSSFMLIRCMR